VGGVKWPEKIDDFSHHDRLLRTSAAKAATMAVLYGTAEAVPFPKPIRRWNCEAGALPKIYFLGSIVKPLAFPEANETNDQ